MELREMYLTMERGRITAQIDRGVDDIVFLGRLEVDEDYMDSHQIGAFVDSVVKPQLNLFAREIETEIIEEEAEALGEEA